MRKIVIIRCVTVEAFGHVMATKDTKGEVNKGSLYELVPGDILSVCGRIGDTLRLPRGYADLPRNTWEWVRPGVTARQFVEAWQNGESVFEVAATLGKSPRKVMNWERRFRREGVRLKTLPLT